MAPPDRFALTKERVAAVLEEAIKADGLRGAPFVDAVVSAIRDGSPPVVAASGSLSSVDDKAEKKAADLLDPEEKSTLDLSMRIFLDSMLTKAKASKLSAEEAGVVELLDRSIELAGANAADWNTPFALIEDLFDLLLISELESIFPLIECRGDALAKLMGGPPSSSQRAKLTFIRTCNELLRRLSKSMNTNFCGRVLMLMAYMLPLSERSGVNLKGLHAPSHLLLEQDDAPDTGAPRPGESTEGGPAESLYASFWGLQSAFADPSAAMASEAWAVLVERLEAVLQGFANIVSTEPAADTTAGASATAEAGDTGGGGDTGGAGGGEAMEVEAEAMGKEVYFAKFLTSPKLLQLQLRDSYFRRHVLVQLLIFLQTVTTERKGAPPLSPAQHETCDSLRSRATELLCGVAPHGPAFAAALDRLLTREVHWLEWKANGCPAFDRVAAEKTAGAPAAGAKRRAPGPAARAKRLQLGNSELSRLWNLGDNSLTAIAAEGNKQAVPGLAEYLQPLIEQLDPASGIEEEYKLTHDKVWMWKALRLMSSKDVSLLSKISATAGSMEAAVAHWQEKQNGNAAREEVTPMDAE